MPPSKFELKVKANGKYDLAGLSESDFNKAMGIIVRQKAKARRVAKNTISPRLLRSKNQKEIDRLSTKPDGTPFTREDLIALDAQRKSHEKKFGKATAGITLSNIIAQSRDIDIKRANNAVNDSSGIKKANMNAVKDNLVTYRVMASDKNGDDAHMVKLRFEEWDNRMHNAAPTKQGYQKATKRMVKGMISFDCTCGRHQYWYRYLATIGNYCVAPPKEFSPPKIKNPEFKGVACKHVLHVLNKVQAASWINQLAIFMERQASKIGGGSLRRKVIDDKAAKQQKKLIKKEIDLEEHAVKFQKYQERQHKLSKKLIADGKAIDRIRKNAERARKAANEAIKRADKAEQSLSKSVSMNKDMARFSFDMFKDVNASKKLNDNQLRQGFADKMGMSVNELGNLLDE